MFAVGGRELPPAEKSRLRLYICLVSVQREWQEAETGRYGGVGGGERELLGACEGGALDSPVFPP